MNNTKFVACVMGVIATLWLAIIGKMDGNVTLCLTTVIGGYYGANAVITRKALENGKDPNGV